MNKDDRNKIIEEYGHGYDLLMATLADIPRMAWDFKPASNEWSIHEILLHFKDSESLGVVRLNKLIAEPGTTLMTYAEDKWAKALGYQNQDVDDALKIFQLTRRTTYHLLKSLPDRVFDQSVMHPEYDEPYTLEKWLHVYTEHIPEHIEQLKKAYQAWKEKSH